MVLVAVRQDDAAHMLLVFDKLSDVRNDNVNAKQLGLGKHQSGIDDDDVVSPAHGEAVHPELAKAA